MDRILIGIMNHNFERYIEEAIRSALDQTFACDIMITDDASTDGSISKISKYPCKHLITHSQNSGDELRGMEEIIEYGTIHEYHYIYIMSGDDVLYPYCIEKLREKAVESKADWVYGGLDIINDEGRYITSWAYDNFPENVVDAIGYMAQNRSLGTTMGSLFSTKFLRGKRVSRFPNTNFSLDASTAIDWYRDWPIIARVPQQIVQYRQHNKSRSSIDMNERIIMQSDMRTKLIQTFGARTVDACFRAWRNRGNRSI